MPDKNQKSLFASNFSVIVLASAVDDPAKPGDPLVIFSFRINGQQQPEIHQLRLSEFKSIDFETLDIRCRCTGDQRAFGQALYSNVREFIAEGQTRTSYFSHTGWARLNEHPVYMAGNRAIGAEGWVPVNQYAVVPHLAGLTLEVDPNVSEDMAARYVRRLCSIYPGVSDLLVASTVVAHLFSLFEAAGVRPRLVMYLTGSSMTGKTTLARLIGQTYNRSAPDDPHLINLISTTAAVHNRVAALSDCVCILDDLFPGGTLAESRRREERLSEVIRTTGNGAPKEKMGGKQAISQVPRGVVFATAEYPLTTLSTVARVVTLPMEAHMDVGALESLQVTPKALSSFWFYFIQWACIHHDDLVNQINSRFAELRRRGNSASSLDRGLDAHRVLTTGMEILADYMMAVDFRRGKAIDRMKQQFRESSTKAYRRQKRELEQLRSRSEQNRFSKFLAGLCFSGQIEEGKKKKLGKEYPAVISHGLLYIRLEDLTGRVRRHFGDSTVTPQAISAELRRNGLLQMDKSGRSSKKVNKVRYLQVPVKRLEEFTSAESSVSSVGLELPTNGTVNPVDCILSSGRCAK